MPDTCNRRLRALLKSREAVLLPGAANALTARIIAPSRRVVIAGQSDTGLAEIHHVDSPKDAIRLSIRDPRWLSLDAQGGLGLNLSISEEFSALGGPKDAHDINETWTIQELTLEVVGTMVE